MAEFKNVVTEALATLPPEIQTHMKNVVVDVAEEADLATLRRAGFTRREIDEDADLFGLFEPFPLAMPDLELAERPHRLHIFKAPHEEEFPDRQRMLIEIKKTVIHELAHHFGWSDRDLEKFDAKVDPFGEG
jgi:predicted Zn-dependent protease with MMP-like domain